MAAKTFAAYVDLISRVQEIVSNEPPKIDFPEEQIKWFKKVIDDHKNVRWTLLFLHQPVWNNPSESFIKMDSFIQDRNFTFFTGQTATRR